MEEILKSIGFIEDIRQQAKVRHKLLDVIVIVLFAKLENVDDWEEMEAFAECHEEFLKRKQNPGKFFSGICFSPWSMPASVKQKWVV